MISNEKISIPSILHETRRFNKNHGDKNPEIKKYPESRGLKSSGFFRDFQLQIPARNFVLLGIFWRFS